MPQLCLAIPISYEKLKILAILQGILSAFCAYYILLRLHVDLTLIWKFSVKSFITLFLGDL